MYYLPLFFPTQTVGTHTHITIHYQLKMHFKCVVAIRKTIYYCEEEK